MDKDKMCLLLLIVNTKHLHVQLHPLWGSLSLSVQSVYFEPHVQISLWTTVQVARSVLQNATRVSILRSTIQLVPHANEPLLLFVLKWKTSHAFLPLHLPLLYFLRDYHMLWLFRTSLRYVASARSWHGAFLRPAHGGTWRRDISSSSL